MIDCFSVVLEGLMPYGINEDFQGRLVSYILEQEIYDALFSIGSDKSPGPDGFNSFFYKKAWSIVGEDFKKAVKFFLKGLR